jgi:hypothetical protein
MTKEDHMAERERMRIVTTSGESGNWVDAGSLRFDSLYIGKPNDPASPVGVFVIASPTTGDRVAGLRTHDTEVLIAVIRGSIQLDGAWMGQGDLQFAAKGVPHGDLVIGPEGATFMIFFAQRQGMIPTFVDDEDQANFDRDLKDAVEEVAHGKSEASVALLAPRKTHRSRRGVKVTNFEEAALVAESPDEPAPEGIFRTRIDNDDLPWGPPILNGRTGVIVLGNLDDPYAPTIGVINVNNKPGDRTRSRHIHETDAINLIIEGALYMDGVWLTPGVSKVVSANYEYGDGLAGPQGVKFLEIWADQFGAMPSYTDPEDQAYFDVMKSHGHLSERLVI